MSNTVNEEELVARLQQAESMEDILTVLQEAGIEMTEESLISQIDSQEEELTEENLETVSGGFRGGMIWKAVNIAVRLIISGKKPLAGVGGPVSPIHGGRGSFGGGVFSGGGSR